MDIKKTIILIGCILITLCVLQYLNNKSIESFYAIQRKSSYNHKVYTVQDLHNPEIASDLLAEMKHRTSQLTDHLKSKNGNDQNVQRLIQRLENTIIDEAPFEEDSSSYTINKGEQISFCLREKNPKKSFHNIKTLMFVLIHELAHVMAVSEGHTQEFMKHFRFLLREAANAGLYDPINYRNDPMTYCGVRVTHNPYYNNL